MKQLENPNERYAATQRQMVIMMFAMFFLIFFMPRLFSPKPQAEQQNKKPAPTDPIANLFDEDEGSSDENADPDAPPAQETKHPASYVTLGSADPQDPYNMLVTLSSRGAVVRQIDLNRTQYRDTQDRTGWLGQIVVERADMPENGCPVQVVGKGTPAETAGLLPGDLIVGFNGANIASFDGLRNALLATRPNQTCELVVKRGESQQEERLTVRLGQAPMSITRPETSVVDFDTYRQLPGLHVYDAETQPPLSFAMTFGRIDNAELSLPETLDFENRSPRSGDDMPRDTSIENELPGLALRSEHWKLESANETEVVFMQYVPKKHIEVRKTYRLEPVTDAKADPGYTLTLKIDVKNVDTRPHEVNYWLDGPTGLPIQGAWYSTGRKTGPGWTGYGLRDLVIRPHGKSSDVLRCNQIAHDKLPPISVDLATRKKLVDYIGVDTQYFQCTMLMRQDDNAPSNLEYVAPMRVGDYARAWPVATNVSFRLCSADQLLQPQESFSHEYQIFAGPKQPQVLEAYGLRDTLYYGWFAWFVKPLLALLHFFHKFLFSYALAIIMLTIVVRLCLYRLNRKQLLSTMKMQEMKPEMEKITEKYKDDMEGRTKALQELYRKHKFNPLSGCLPMLIQLPILIALFRALSVDVELHGASLLGSGVRWCSDMAAPDQLWDWSHLWIAMGWPGFNTGQGMFALGPYLNVLPIIATVLIMIQQKVMMPPPTSDQEKQMRTMMKFMMIFMAFMFYKMPSGLCVYFIAGSLWAFAEKKFLPKPTPPSDTKNGGKSHPAEIIVDGRKHAVKPNDPKHESKKRKRKENPLVNEDERTGFWHDMKARWKRVLEEAQHRPGDSQKPGKRTRKK